MRCGVLDLGSSSFRALVADVDDNGIRRVVFERGTVLRLGEHADTADGFPQLFHERAVHAMSSLLERTRVRASEPVRVVATGALRDTEHGMRFVADASARLRTRIEILDGCDEARLTWLGVSAELAGSHGRLAVLDLGAGSFEIATGTTSAVYASSVPLGVLRLRCMTPPAIRDRVEEYASQALDELAAFRPETLALSSGTARSLLRLGRKLHMFADEQRYVPSGAFLELARKIPSLPQAALLDLGVSRHRLDTIAGGATLFATALARLARPVVYIARSALREGVLVDQFRRTATRRAFPSSFAIAQ